VSTAVASVKEAKGLQFCGGSAEGVRIEAPKAPKRVRSGRGCSSPFPLSSGVELVRNNATFSEIFFHFLILKWHIFGAIFTPKF